MDDSFLESVRSNDHDSITKLILSSIPSGDTTRVIELLERVISKLKGSESNKRARPVTSASASEEGKALTSSVPFLLHDEIDHAPITLALQFPGESNLMAYMIGTKGNNVITFGRKTDTRMQIEAPDARGPDGHRHVFIRGALGGVVRAYKVSNLLLRGIPCTVD